jgi:hypothetical protein
MKEKEMLIKLLECFYEDNGELFFGLEESCSIGKFFKDKDFEKKLISLIPESK